MSLEWIISLLVQFPLLGIFIWYNEKKDKLFLDALDKQRTANQDIMNKLFLKIDDLHKAHEDHDQRMTQAVAQMEERTRRVRAR